MNGRPLPPQGSALPGCATLRLTQRYVKSVKAQEKSLIRSSTSLRILPRTVRVLARLIDTFFSSLPRLMVSLARAPEMVRPSFLRRCFIRLISSISLEVYSRLPPRFLRGFLFEPLMKCFDSDLLLLLLLTTSTPHFFCVAGNYITLARQCHMY